AVEKSALIDGQSIQAGSVILGLASSGAHANGYSLVRKVIDYANATADTEINGQRLQELAMAPTRIYVKSVLAALTRHGKSIQGLAHITGGGLLENIPRILPAHLGAVLHRDAWEQPALFQWLQQQGKITDLEMARVFNCGIGMAVVVEPDQAAAIAKTLREQGETVWELGQVAEYAANDAKPRVLIR